MVSKRNVTQNEVERSLQDIDRIYFDINPRPGTKGEEIHLISNIEISGKKYQIAIDLIIEGKEHLIKSVVDLTKQYLENIEERSILMFE